MKNPETDRRRIRRPLSVEEFERLLHATEQGPSIQNISGPDRAILYILACDTRFRRNEIGSVTARSFEFESDPPLLTVSAGLRLLTGEWSPNDLLERASGSKLKSSMAHFWIGAKCLWCDGTREDAIHHFEECLQQGFINVDYFYIVKAYLELLKDPGFPRWGPCAIRPSGDESGTK